MPLTILSGTIALSIQGFDDQLTHCPKDVRPYSPHNLNPQNISLAATGFWTWPVEGNKGGSKAGLVQVNGTPIICLRNFINKKVGNRKNQSHFYYKNF